MEKWKRDWAKTISTRSRQFYSSRSVLRYSRGNWLRSIQCSTSSWNERQRKWICFQRKIWDSQAHSLFPMMIMRNLSLILKRKIPPAVLPIQIAYYAGLRIGEVCGLTLQDINLEEQYLTVKRSVRYDGAKHKTIIGPTKRKKVRMVDFGDTLTTILKKAAFV